MKKTKFLTIAALLVLLSSFFTGDMGRVSAEGEGAKLEIGSAEGYVGDTVSVTVSLTENPGIAGMGVWVCYDKAALRVVDVVLSGDVFVEDLAECQKAGDGYVGYAAAGSRDNVKTGQLFTIQFEIIQGAATGDSLLTYSGNNGAPEASNADGETVALSLDTGKVTVMCSHENTTSSETPATCTEAGSKTVICADCGQVLSTEDIAATGHTMGAYTVIKEATCTESGEETATCSICGVVDTREIPATGHVFGDFAVTKEETETEEGEIKATCIIDDVETTWIIPAIRRNDFQASTLTGEGKELEGAEFVEGTQVSFVASVQGVNKEAPETGDVRYVPADWRLGQEVGEMTASEDRYSAAVQVDKAGNYELEISYDRQVFDGENWKAIGTYTYTATVCVTEKKVNTPSGGNNEKPSGETSSGSNGSGESTDNDNAAASTGSDGTSVPATESNVATTSPKTGEENRIAVAGILLGISSGMIAVIAMKRKKAK